jgi:glycosyltransferase involved in cell wall biosynthesis
MKILHICYSDGRFGAGIAAMRIVKAQRNYGIDAQMFVVLKYTDNPFVRRVSRSKELYIKFCHEISTFILKKMNKSTNPILHSINFFGGRLISKINKIDCDIVHLHWINSEMMSIKDVAKIKKTIVWTFHDSWAFCGAEHYQNGMDDINYTTKYLPNPYNGFNINRWTLNRKKRQWENKKIQIITPSEWETESAQKSVLFNNSKILTIPNCLNTDIFKPIDKSIARDILNLAREKKYILFGAFGGTANVIKGGDLLISSLKIFAEKYPKNNTELLVFGTSAQLDFPNLGLPVHFLGKIADEYTMSLIYNTADVMLVPSRMDNLPQTATEPAACGIPIVCFNVGGLVDIVKHKQTGYIAKRFNTEDFASGINWILNEADIFLLSKQAREKAIVEYDELKCAKSHLKIYNDILKSNVND